MEEKTLPARRVAMKLVLLAAMFLLLLAVCGALTDAVRGRRPALARRRR